MTSPSTISATRLGPDGRELVETAFAVHDEGTPGAELGKRLGEERHERGGVDAEDAVARTGRVRERAEHVENSADPDLLPHWRDEAHRRMVRPART